MRSYGSLLFVKLDSVIDKEFRADDKEDDDTGDDIRECRVQRELGGNLGRALAATHMFERRGVKRLAMFDVDPAVVGTQICGIPVYHIDDIAEYCKKEKITIGVLTVPKEAAYDVSMKMIDAGVTGLWNFANMELKISKPGVIVENIHLGDSLMKLCYELKTEGEGRAKK